MKTNKRTEVQEEDAPVATQSLADQVVLSDQYNPEDGPPTKLEHFPIYNKYARKNKKLVKVPTEDFYPKRKVRFQRFEQPNNVLKCRVRNKDIDWSGQLIPGCIYDLCLPVIHWLTSLSEPVYAEVKIKNDAGGGRYIEKTETRQVSERQRFSLQPVDFGV